MNRSALQCVSGHPLLRLEVIESEGATVAPGPELILEWPRESRCEERALLTDILPDRGLDVATSQRGHRLIG